MSPDGDARASFEVDELAKTLAQIELAALKGDHPDDWQSVSVRLGRED
ncbi:MAG: hypothetical protein R3C56_35610 [Pirellulaceae bacterium]